METEHESMMLAISGLKIKGEINFKRCAWIYSHIFILRMLFMIYSMTAVISGILQFVTLFLILVSKISYHLYWSYSLCWSIRIYFRLNKQTVPYHFHNYFQTLQNWPFLISKFAEEIHKYNFSNFPLNCGSSNLSSFEEQQRGRRDGSARAASMHASAGPFSQVVGASAHSSHKWSFARKCQHLPVMQMDLAAQSPIAHMNGACSANNQSQQLQDYWKKHCLFVTNIWRLKTKKNDDLLLQIKSNKKRISEEMHSTGKNNIQN